jgi:hypothetical protein
LRIQEKTCFFGHLQLGRRGNVSDYIKIVPGLKLDVCALGIMCGIIYDLGFQLCTLLSARMTEAEYGSDSGSALGFQAQVF